ncbi:MAG TPA: helix-turn-helix domain-containing protein [Ornithinibacter sp.]|nr:helix-turn-helix domain-containing protein [Ornithinibacter sp.]
MKKIAPLGPAPTPVSGDPALDVTDPSRRRLLQVIARRPTSSPPSVGDLVATVGGHPNTTRHHLRVLVAAGLVLEQHAPPEGGRGRPAARYALTRAGRDAASPTPGGGAAEEYVALAAAFSQRLAERDGDPGADARAIGRAWGAGLAARHAADEPAGGAVGEQVVGLLDRLGFSPDAEPEAGGGSGTTVLLRTCPLLDAARRHPEVVCQVHLGLVAGALEAHHEPSDGLRLAPFSRPGACELTLPPTLVR